jgi:outer membrane protein TolC
MRCKHLIPKFTATAGLFLSVFSSQLLWAAKPAPEPHVDYRPSKASGRAIGTSTAVRLALDNDPAIFLARQNSQLSGSILQQSEGSFDSLVFVEPVLDYTTRELTSQELRNEVDKRRLLRQLDVVFTAVADNIQDQLDSGVFADIPGCGSGQISITIGNETYSVSCPPPSVVVDINSILDAATLIDEQEIADSLAAAYRAQLETLLVTSRFIAFVGRELLRTTGVAPTINDKMNLSLSLGLEKLYRNGITFSPQLQFQVIRDNYRGKPLDPTYGGKGVLIAYRSRVGAVVGVPLGKGRGVVATDAAERAARFGLQASLESEAHTMSSSVLNALISYWEVVAAQQRVSILEESVARNAKLVEIGETLIEAEELARGDLVFVRSLLSATEGSLDTARRLLVEARFRLATTLGLDVSTLREVPLAADGFPPLPTDSQMAAWTKLSSTGAAFDYRADLKAALLTQKSAKTLADGAQADLKRRVDLNVSAWYSGLYEDNRDLGMRTVGLGLGRLVDGGLTGPSAKVALDFELPFQNNEASGRFLEARSLERRSSIEADNLRRLISANIEKYLGQIADARREVERHQTAVEYHGEILEAETERFRYGEATSIDVVQTEENQVGEQLALIASRQRLATLVSQLRFELGDFLRYRVEDDRVVIEAVRPLALNAVGESAHTTTTGAGG